MSTATDILARLEELWENAEPGPTREGDAIIFRYGEGDFKIEPCAGRSRDSQDHVRTLERAKPKAPEWEAVVASYLHDEEHKREVYFRTPADAWESVTRYTYADELVDPVPLAEMPEREALVEAIHSASPAVGPVEGGALADAVLELLKRR